MGSETDFEFEIPADDATTNLLLGDMLGDFNDFEDDPYFESSQLGPPAKNLSIIVSEDADSLRREVSSLAGEREAAALRVKERDRVISDLQMNLKALQRKLHETESVLATRTIEVESVRNALASSTTEGQSMLVSALRSRVLELEATVRENADMRACDTSHTADIEQEAQLAAADATAAARAWQQQLTELHSRFTEVQEALDSEMRTHHQCREELATARRDIAQLNGEVAERDRELSAMRHANDELSAEVQQLTLTLDASRTQLTAVQVDTSAYDRRIAELTAANQQMSEELKLFRSQEVQRTARGYETDRQQLLDELQLERRRVLTSAQQETERMQKIMTEQAIEHSRELEALRANVQTLHIANVQLEAQVLDLTRAANTKQTLPSPPPPPSQPIVSLAMRESEKKKLLEDLHVEQELWIQQQEAQNSRLIKLFQQAQSAEMRNLRSDLQLSNAQEIEKIRRLFETRLATERNARRVRDSATFGTMQFNAVSSSLGSLPRAGSPPPSVMQSLSSGHNDQHDTVTQQSVLFVSQAPPAVTSSSSTAFASTATAAVSSCIGSATAIPMGTAALANTAAAAVAFLASYDQQQSVISTATATAIVTASTTAAAPVTSFTSRSLRTSVSLPPSGAVSTVSTSTSAALPPLHPIASANSSTYQLSSSGFVATLSTGLRTSLGSYLDTSTTSSAARASVDTTASNLSQSTASSAQHEQFQRDIDAAMASIQMKFAELQRIPITPSKH
eukprot:TRINITY_DN3041_c0_g1_i2.p1 TRINITY_DN3041_c0_g1~~TRINITY_DN3041_c0_g1_i2.p1  ORF type:complete len:741 (-),score=195.91 TRINITY_DN3041_c0_g1_i2:1855-4077(-)